MLGRGHWQREQLGADGIKVTSGAAPRCVLGAWAMVKELAATYTKTFKMSRYSLTHLAASQGASALEGDPRGSGES